MRIYLSGRMGNRPGNEVLRERREATALCQELDLEPVDPARGEAIQDNDQLIDMSMDFMTMKQYVAKDEYALSTCDIILVLTGDTPSDGTWWEMGIAKGAFNSGLNLPIIMVAPRRAKCDLMGFSNIHADAIFRTQAEAIEFIAEHYAEV